MQSLMAIIAAVPLPRTHVVSGAGETLLSAVYFATPLRAGQLLASGEGVTGGALDSFADVSPVTAGVAP